MDVVKTIIRKDGLLGLYVGMESTFWRYVVILCGCYCTIKAKVRRHLWWNAGYFGCIFKVRAMLPKPEVRDIISSLHILETDRLTFVFAFRTDQSGARRERPDRWYRRRVRRHCNQYAVRTFTCTLRVINPACSLLYRRFDVRSLLPRLVGSVHTADRACNF